GAVRFFLVDGLGSLLYGICFIGLGFLFSSQIHQIGSAIGQLGGGALGLLFRLAPIYIGCQILRRRLRSRRQAVARVTPEELRQKQTSGENLVILDLRSPTELELDPSIIQGAIHLAVTEVENRHGEIPRDRDVIVYCSCPNEVTSARVALLLRRKGITRVRPLLGGIDAWREQNYPMQTFSPAVTTTSGTSSAGQLK